MLIILASTRSDKNKQNEPALLADTQASIANIPNISSPENLLKEMEIVGMAGDAGSLSLTLKLVG